MRDPFTDPEAELPVADRLHHADHPDADVMPMDVRRTVLSATDIRVRCETCGETLGHQMRYAHAHVMRHGHTVRATAAEVVLELTPQYPPPVLQLDGQPPPLPWLTGPEDDDEEQP